MYGCTELQYQIYFLLWIIINKIKTLLSPGSLLLYLFLPRLAHAAAASLTFLAVPVSLLAPSCPRAFAAAVFSLAYSSSRYSHGSLPRPPGLDSNVNLQRQAFQTGFLKIDSIPVSPSFPRLTLFLHSTYDYLEYFIDFSTSFCWKASSMGAGTVSVLPRCLEQCLAHRGH